MLVALLALPLNARAQGIPFLRNYTAAEYGAHNRNFDIITTEDGLVFVANFEGLLYYDKAQWHILHTPGVQRLTAVFRDASNRVWTGGYNYMGYVAVNENGGFGLHALKFDEKHPLNGEVTWIWEKDGEIQLLTSDKKIYRVKGEIVEILEDGSVPKSGFTTIGEVKEIKQIQKLDNGLSAIATAGDGLLVVEQGNKVICRINEDNGLCSNNINHITYDRHGTVWGATDNGIFAVNIPTSYSRYTTLEGLKGEVLAIGYLGAKMFVGTLGGLFVQKGMHFEPVSKVMHACWQLAPFGNKLLAATSDGVYQADVEGRVQQLTASTTTAVMAADGGFYSGELDGVFFNSSQGVRRQISTLEKVTQIFKDGDGNLWIKNLYGQICLKPKNGNDFTRVKINGGKDEIATLVIDKSTAFVVTESGAWEWNGRQMVKKESLKDNKLAFPLFSETDGEGRIWLTDQEGKHLYALKDGRRIDAYDKWIRPLSSLVIRALYAGKTTLWAGGDFGLVCINSQYPDPNLETKPEVRIRRILLHGDSLLWGGVGEMPEALERLSSGDRNLTFTYSLSYPSLQGEAHYRYRLNGGDWSAWSVEKITRFINQPYGTYTFEVQAVDASGRLSNIAKIKFTIAYPFYARWYMIILYLFVLSGLIYLVFKYRMKRLLKDKMKLERIVSERTAEIAQQKDEIEEKSNSLQQALNDLNNAQKELVRQEKMATAGKLTQGLIDRILNPMNYINNFSKLSSSLVNDVEANIDDEKERMDEENYEDTKDVLDMLRQNLQKVEEHGMNTTRTLKAMEELLKDRSGGMVEMDVTDMLRKDFEMLNGYFHKEIEEAGIKTVLDVPDDPVHINGNAEQLSKSVMSILANGIYAVKKKKSGGAAFTPEVSIRAEKRDGLFSIHLRDNGIGIEDTILKKIFDPFFTTKTTGEAAGVGLYLSREIAQNHGGDISVDSVKNEYSEFTITLPLWKPQTDEEKADDAAEA